MDIIEYRDFCLSLPLSSESTPFDEDTLVFKVVDKMFAYGGMANFNKIALKCEPERAIELKEKYAEIGAAPHTRTHHWIGVDMTGNLSDSLIKGLITRSYKLVILGMPKYKQAQIIEELGELWNEL